jgi:hypothetical protein
MQAKPPFIDAIDKYGQTFYSVATPGGAIAMAETPHAVR